MSAVSLQVATWSDGVRAPIYLNTSQACLDRILDTASMPKEDGLAPADIDKRTDVDPAAQMMAQPTVVGEHAVRGPLSSAWQSVYGRRA